MGNELILPLVGAAIAANLVFFRGIVASGAARGNPCWYFSLANAVMALGTLSLLDVNIASDRRHATILIVTALTYTLGATIGLRSRSGIAAQADTFYATKLTRLSLNTEQRLEALILFAGLISLVSFLLIGYNLFFTGLQDQIRGTSSEFTTLRLNSYAGERYFAPGYVNQFKNVVFPIGSLMVIYARRTSGRPVGWRWALPPVAVVFLVGSGQRGAFVLSLFSVALFYHLTRQPGSGSKARNVKLGTIGFAIFSLVSSFQGRLRLDASVLTKTVDTISNRLLQSNQKASVAGFRVVDQIDITYGEEWFQAGLGILPNHPGSDLSSIVFSELTGGRRGTAPVSVWGSFWHNGGWIAVITGALFLGIFHAYSFRRMVNGPRSVPRMAGYSVVVVLLSTWVAGSFTYLLNNGLLGISLMAVLVGRGAWRNSARAPVPELASAL